MAGYTFIADGGYKSNLAGGSMTPTMPTFSAGNLLLLQTGVNSISLGTPTISGWTKLTLNTTAPCDAIYALVAAGGETSPTFLWDGTHQAYSRIVSFGGDVYTDLSTIVVQIAERATNTTGKIAVNATSAPSMANCLAIRGGHCIKTATNNGSTFADWITDTGVYTKIGGTQLVQTGTALAAGLWYDLQATAAATSSDTAALTAVDSSGNSQGYTLILQPLVATAPARTRSLLGVGS
jgi:hypothetical protein